MASQACRTHDGAQAVLARLGRGVWRPAAVCICLSFLLVGNAAAPARADPGQNPDTVPGPIMVPEGEMAVPVTPPMLSMAAASDAIDAAEALGAPGVAPLSPQTAIPGLLTPQGVFVDPVMSRVYVSSYDNDKVFVLDVTTLKVLKTLTLGAGDRPWGVTINPQTGKLYVAGSRTGAVHVYDAQSLDKLTVINVSFMPSLTFLDSYGKWVFAVSNRLNDLVVIDATKDQVVKELWLGNDMGPFGLAADPILGRVYVGSRTAGTILTFAEASNWEQVGTAIHPCGSNAGEAPGAMDLDVTRRYLYVSCFSGANADKAVQLTVDASGLGLLRWLAVGNGGPDGGGGVVVNPTTGNVFITNSAASTVSVNSRWGQPLATVQVDEDPYGIGVDPESGRVFSGNRDARPGGVTGGDLTAFNDVYVAGLNGPNGVAVDPVSHRVYVTNRLNGMLSMYDGAQQLYNFSYKLYPNFLGSTNVGGMPWGVAVNPNNGKVYVASFLNGKLYVYNGATLGQMAAIDVGPEATFAAVNTRTGQAFAVSHRNNQVTIVDDATYATTTVASGGQGAWGLTVNPRLNHLYVGHRDGGLLNVLDGTNGWHSRQQLTPCGSQGQLFAMDFNPVSSRLYITCAIGGPGSSVDQAVVLFADPQTGVLSLLATLAIGAGGENGGGGVAVNTSSGRALITNSQAGTVTYIGADDKVQTTLPIGSDPFGIAVDPTTQRVFVGLRSSHNLAVSADYTSAIDTSPKIVSSQTIGCAGRQITVQGSYFPYDPAHGLDSVTVSLVGAARVTVPINAGGAFTAQVVPTQVNDDYTIAANITQVPSIGAGVLLHTPRTGLPIIFVPGAGGSELVVNQATHYWAGPDPAQLHWDRKLFTYAQGERAWLDYPGVYSALLGMDSRYYDILELLPDGSTPRKDSPPPGTPQTTPDIVVGGPVQELSLPYPTIKLLTGEVVWKDVTVDVYKNMFDSLRGAGYVDGLTLFSYPYDWRRELINTDTALERVIVKAMYASGKSKVVLLTHSTGGVVIRNYLLRKGTTRVDQVISMGTPYLGLVKPAFKALVTGDDGGVGWHLTAFGIPTSFGVGIDPKELQRLSRNWPSLYELMPTDLWFQAGTSGDGWSPPYIVIEHAKVSYVGPVPVAIRVEQEALDYAASQAFKRGYNSSLVTAGETLQAQGIGDMSRLTDRYLAQRIAGIGQDTGRRVRFAERFICVGLICTGPWHWIEMETIKQGDDTVPLRSAVGTNLRAGDQSYYCVESAHGALPANPSVHTLLANMLQGQLCSNTQAAWAACPSVNAESADAGEAAPSSGAPAVPPAPTYEMHLFGNGTLEVWDSAGNHAGPIPGYPQYLDNGIKGVDVQRAGENTMATITMGGAYTVTVRGLQAGGVAELRLSELSSGSVSKAAQFSAFPLGASAVATMTLTLPYLPATVQMQLRSDPTAPVQMLTATSVTGAAAGDDVAPVAGINLDLSAKQVTVLAADNEGGSGVAHIYVSTTWPAQGFTEYTGPFALPKGVGCITAYAVDNAGNTGGPGYQCLTRLPLLRR